MSETAEVITAPKTVYVTYTGPGGKPMKPLLEVHTGSTPEDFLPKLGFSSEEQDLVIKNGPVLASDADLYNSIGPTTEFQVVPKMEQGSSEGASSEAPFLSRFFRRFHREPAPLRVEHVQKPFWQERGWSEVAPGVYRGSYLTPFRSFPGEITQRGSSLTVCIDEKPAEVDYHPHGSCLWPHGQSYFLHYKRQPTSVDAALIDMERFLTTSFRRARAARTAS